MDNRNFINWLNEELQTHNMKPADLAKKAGYDNSVISNILNNKRGVGPEMCTAIAGVFGYSPIFVFSKAGLLPPMTEREAKLLQLEEIYRNIGDDKREEFLRYGEYLREQEERSRGSASKLNPKTETR